MSVQLSGNLRTKHLSCIASEISKLRDLAATLQDQTRQSRSLDCLVPPLRNKQTKQIPCKAGKPSQTLALPCLSVLLSGHPPCGRIIASQSQSASLSSLTLPGPRTKYPRTFQVLSHFTFAFRWPPFASQLVDIVWRCDEADRDRSSAWRQTTTAANPNANPSYSPCPAVPAPALFQFPAMCELFCGSCVWL